MYNNINLSSDMVMAYGPGSIFRNPITGKWEFPVYNFNMKILNPHRQNIDILNNDKNYRHKVAKNFYTLLTEKWLYNDHHYRKLLKYFTTGDKTGTGVGQIHLVDNLDDAKATTLNKKYRNHIFLYIEKYFITKKFVYKSLSNFTKKYDMKWYNLMDNESAVKKYLANNLRDLIANTIYKLESRDASNN